MLSKLRNKAAATKFFARALEVNGLPRKIVIDKSGANTAGITGINRMLKRFAPTAGEANVGSIVARRMVKKQQIRWSERGANLRLQVRVVLANGDLAERLAYWPPIQPRQTIILPLVPMPLFQRAA